MSPSSRRSGSASSNSAELKRLEAAKSIAWRKNRLDEVSAICSHMGELFMRAGKFQEALREHGEDEQVCESRSDKLGVAQANRKMGEVLVELALTCESKAQMCEYFKRGLACQKKHLELARAAESRLEEQRALTTVGRTYLKYATAAQEHGFAHKKAKLHTKAQQYCTQALETIPAIPDTECSTSEKVQMRVILYTNLGGVAEVRGDVVAAAANYARAEALAAEHGLTADLHRVLDLQTSLAVEKGDWDSAADFSDKAVGAVDGLRHNPDHASLLCDTLQLRVKIMLQRRCFEEARDALVAAYNKAAATANWDQQELKETKRSIIDVVRIVQGLATVTRDDEDYGDTDRTIKTYEDIGDRCTRLMSYAAALFYYGKALALAEASRTDKKTLSGLYTSMAGTLFDLERYSEALEFHAKELKLLEDPSEAVVTLCEMAKCAEMGGSGGHAHAISLLKEATGRARQSGNARKEIRVLFELIRLYKEEGDSTSEMSEVEKRISALASSNNLTNEDLAEIRELAVDGDGDNGGSLDQDDAGEDSEVDVDRLLETASDKDEFGSRDVKKKPTRTKIRNNKGVAKNTKGETDLHLKCQREGNAKAIVALLERGHPVDPVDYAGFTPIMEACNFGFLEYVKLLVEHGADVNRRAQSDVTALIDACTNGHVDIAKFLLENGAKPQLQDSDGWTALDHLQDFVARNRDDLREDDLAVANAVLARLKLDISRLESSGHVVYKKPKKKASDALIRVGGEQDEVREERRNRVQRLRTQRGPDLRRLVDEDDDIDSSLTADYIGAMASVGSHSSGGTASSARKGERAQVTSVSASTFENMMLSDRDWLEDDVGERSRGKRKKDGCSFSSGSSRNYSAGSASSKRQRPLNTSSLSDCEELSGASFDLSSTPLADRTLPSEETDEVEAAAVAWRPRDPVAATSAISEDAYRTISLTSAPSTLKVKVELCQRVLLVPLNLSDPGEISVEWLITETVNRYYSTTGRKPSIKLLTCDGAELHPSDPLSSVVTDNDLLKAEVTAWEPQSLQARYAHACSCNQSEPVPILEDIRCKLEECNVHSRLDLSTLGVGPEELEPAAWALRWHADLTEMCLARNRLGLEGVRLLCGAITGLTSLRTLDLAANGLTAEAIASLRDAFSTLGDNRLSTLRLGFNPLGDDSTAAVLALASHLPHLECLDLMCCSLTPMAAVRQKRHLWTAGLGALGKLAVVDLALNGFGQEERDFVSGCCSNESCTVKI